MQHAKNRNNQDTLYFQSRGHRKKANEEIVNAVTVVTDPVPGDLLSKQIHTWFC